MKNIVPEARLIRVIAGLLLLGLAWGGPLAAADAPQTLGERHQLPNGLVWLFSPQSDLPLINMNLLIRAGVLQDPPAKAGLANLTAELLLMGTKTRSAAQIAEALDFRGIKLGAGAADDYAVISLTVLKKDLAAGLELFKDILLNPAFAPPEVTRKVERLKAALKSDEDNPGVVVARAFNRQLFGAFPYGHPIRGTAEGLSAIKPPDLKEFHQRYYRPNNAILSVVGDLSPEEANKLVQETFGPWPQAPIPATQLPPIPPLNETRVSVINKDISQANILLGNLGIARRNPDFYALQVMNYILGGGGFASRLMDNIRDNRGLAYAVGSAFDPGLEPGYFAVSLETKNVSADLAVKEVLAEIKRIQTQPVSPEELADAKSYLIGSFPRKMDSMGKRARLMGVVEFYGLGLDYPWRYPGLIRGLTAADLQKVAQKYLHPDKYLLVVVGKKSEMPPPLGEAAPLPAKEKKDASK